MKLKKAMKKYDIEVIPETEARFAHYKIGRKYVYFGRVTESWWGADGRIFDSEEEAVSWLIEGATPLSPMERAMRKWPIRKEDRKYILGDRGVFKSEIFHPGKWLDDTPQPDEEKWTTYTESEAVAYLLEGYKGGDPKLQPINVTIKFDKPDSQYLIDELWRAGYRPTKEVENPEN